VQSVKVPFFCIFHLLGDNIGEMKKTWVILIKKNPKFYPLICRMLIRWSYEI
jgi:hypothetical protein